MFPDEPALGPHLTAAFQRVQALPFDKLGRGAEDPRRPELMTQFLATVREWLDRLGLQDDQVFRSLASQIAPELELPVQMEQWLKDLGESGRIYPSRGRYNVLAGLHGFLCWELLRDAGRVPAVDLPDPYESFLRYLELEGGIYVEHAIFMTLEPDGGTMLLRRFSGKPSSPGESSAGE